MITKKELQNITKKTNLHLYQQEKEYFLKLFLYFYYKKYEDAVFKGGTALRFCYDLERFSEDLDFNINILPKKFEEQVRKTLKNIDDLGFKTKISKQELFKDSYTCEIMIQGPLYDGMEQNRNKIRIDAGKRLKTIKQPKWKLIKSEYPGIQKNFLVKILDEQEILVEKIIALNTRNKGRDVYDTWFLLEIGITLNRTLLNKKTNMKTFKKMPSREDYERDLKYLTKKIIPYEQAKQRIFKEIR